MIDAHPVLDLFFDVKNVEEGRRLLKSMQEDAAHLKELLEEHHPEVEGE